MDGTLSDLNFDEIFWKELIPEVYAEKNNIGLKEAQTKIFQEYEKEYGNKNWTDPEYWFKKLDIGNFKDHIPELSKQVIHYSDVIPVLKELKKEYKLIIITHATKHFIDIKKEIDNLGEYFQKIFSVPDDFNSSQKDKGVYQEILKQLNLQPNELIHVGDDYIFDYEVPTSLGIKSFYLDRKESTSGPHVIKDFFALKEKLTQ